MHEVLTLSGHNAMQVNAQSINIKWPQCKLMRQVLTLSGCNAS